MLTLCCHTYGLWKAVTRRRLLLSYMMQLGWLSSWRTQSSCSSSSSRRRKQ